jgi:hypothetical protein
MLQNRGNHGGSGDGCKELRAGNDPAGTEERGGFHGLRLQIGGWSVCDTSSPLPAMQAELHGDQE